MAWQQGHGGPAVRQAWPHNPFASAAATPHFSAPVAGSLAFTTVCSPGTSHSKNHPPAAGGGGGGALQQNSRNSDAWPAAANHAGGGSCGSHTHSHCQGPSSSSLTHSPSPPRLGPRAAPRAAGSSSGSRWQQLGRMLSRMWLRSSSSGSSSGGSGSAAVSPARRRRLSPAHQGSLGSSLTTSPEASRRGQDRSHSPAMIGVWEDNQHTASVPIQPLSDQMWLTESDRPPNLPRPIARLSLPPHLGHGVA